MKAILFFFSILFSQHLKCQDISVICNYEQRVFNSDTCCWRQLSKKDSFIAAGNLIVNYLDCGNKKRNIHSLNWHAGQMFACAGMNDKAKLYFRKTYNVFYKWFGGKDGKAWYFYAKGSVAFIDKRKKRLQRIINKWNRKLPKDLNYESLVKLYANLNSTYQAVLH